MDKVRWKATRNDWLGGGRSSRRGKCWREFSLSPGLSALENSPLFLLTLARCLIASYFRIFRVELSIETRERGVRLRLISDGRLPFHTLYMPRSSSSTFTKPTATFYFFSSSSSSFCSSSSSTRFTLLSHSSFILFYMYIHIHTSFSSACLLACLLPLGYMYRLWMFLYSPSMKSPPRATTTIASKHPLLQLRYHFPPRHLYIPERTRSPF